MVKAREFQSTSLRRGKWSPEEDQKLIAYIRRYGIWNWNEMPKPAGLLRSGKSCRLRWMNYLRPDIKHGNFSEEEEQIILTLHQELGNRWSTIAARLPGRTDNEIKNYWHIRLKKKRVKNNLVPTIGLQDTKTPAIEANQKHLPEVGSLLPINRVPKSSNLDGCKASLMSSQLSIGDYSSSSSDDPTSGIYGNQIVEGNICSSEIYGELQSLLEQLFPMEGLYMVEGCGPTDPGLMVPTSQREISNEQLQILLEQPFSVEDLDVVELHEATDPGSVMPASQGGFSNEQLQSLLEQPFSMDNLDMIEVYGAKDLGFIVSTPQVEFPDEELGSLIEQPFLIEGLHVVEGYGTIAAPGMEVSTSQLGF